MRNQKIFYLLNWFTRYVVDFQVPVIRSSESSMFFHPMKDNILILNNARSHEKPYKRFPDRLGVI